MEIALITVSVLLVALALYGVGRRARSRNTAEVRRWAASQGWDYTEREDMLHLSRRASVFTGGARRSSDVLRKDYGGLQALSWHYGYAPTRGGLRSHRHVVALALPAELPYLELYTTHDGIWLRPGREIHFSHPMFGHVWHVRGEDERMAYEIIHPRMMDLLMRVAPEGRGFVIEGGLLLTWRDERQNPASIAGELQLLYEIYSLIPAHLWGRPAGP